MDNLLSSAYASGDRVDGVLSPYDGLSIGILSALKGAGYGTADRPYPIVTGQDAEVASVKSIIAGEQYSTIFKDTRNLAQTAATMAADILSGKEPRSTTPPPTRTVRRPSRPTCSSRSSSTRATTPRSWSTRATTRPTS